MVMTVAEVVRQLIEAEDAGKDVNLNKYKHVYLHSFKDISHTP